MKKNKVLIIDSDIQLYKFLKLNLQTRGYELFHTSDGRQALTLFEECTPDIVLLDIAVRPVDGFRICEQIRKYSTIPILFLSAREQLHDRLKCFEVGADDFLLKPFHIAELLARLHALLRRSQLTAQDQGQAGQTTLHVGELSIHYARQQVTMAGCEVALTPIEYRLLAYLGRHTGCILTQYQLLEHVWGPAYVHEHPVLRVNINRLRQKIEPIPAHPCYIITRAGIGYMLASLPPRNHNGHASSFIQRLPWREGEIAQPIHEGILALLRLEEMRQQGFCQETLDLYNRANQTIDVIKKMVYTMTPSE